MVDTPTRQVFRREFFSYPKDMEVLAAKNATLRLRAQSGHIFSFTDLTSAHGAVNFGHLNPAINPFENLASDLVPDYYPPSAASHAEWLVRTLGLETHAVRYQISEDAAVAAAVALAQDNRPGRVLTIDGSIHGGLNPDLRGRRGANARAGEAVVSIPPGGDFFAWGDISCLVYEPIQAAAGFIPLPLPWLRAFSQAAQAAGVIVIADEIQCGFYRFGRLSLTASEYLRPDIYLLGGSMTNGIFPLFAQVHPDGFDHAATEEDGSKPAYHTSSLGLEAAECVARFIDATNIEAEVTRIHSLLSGACERLAGNPQLTDFYLAGPTLSLGVRERRAPELARRCQESGVLISASTNGERVRVAPPITIPSDQLSSALVALEQAAKQL